MTKANIHEVNIKPTRALSWQSQVWRRDTTDYMFRKAKKKWGPPEVFKVGGIGKEGAAVPMPSQV
jgi:hypothetical protein